MIQVQILKPIQKAPELKVISNGLEGNENVELKKLYEAFDPRLGIMQRRTRTN